MREVFCRQYRGSSGVRVSAFTLPTRYVRRGTEPPPPAARLVPTPAFYSFLPAKTVRTDRRGGRRTQRFLGRRDPISPDPAPVSFHAGGYKYFCVSSVSPDTAVI
ncbi:unnamed protein product, partial [Iphiclides podalirius]